MAGMVFIATRSSQQPPGSLFQRAFLLSKGTTMSKSTFAVFLPDRHAPICVEADSFAYYGCDLSLLCGEQMVARTSDRGFLVRSDLLRKPSLEAGALPTELIESRAEPIGTAMLSEFKTHPAPAWPFSVGVAVGVLSSASVAIALLMGS